jgi:hypothetical protein
MKPSDGVRVDSPTLPEFSMLTDAAKCHISIKTDTPADAQRLSEIIEQLADGVKGLDRG